jgi:hypothetical protein
MPRKYISKKTKTTVADRSSGYCEYCKFLKKYANASFVIDRIKPIALGGTDELDNLAYSCTACNSYKGAFIEATDPDTNEVVPFFHPRYQSWLDHFEWSKDALTIIGITAIGRATVDRLKTNREGLIFLESCLFNLVNIRQLNPPPSTAPTIAQTHPDHAQIHSVAAQAFHLHP